MKKTICVKAALQLLLVCSLISYSSSYNSGRNLRQRFTNESGYLTCTLYDTDVILPDERSSSEVMCEDEVGSDFEVVGLKENTTFEFISGETVIKVSWNLIREGVILLESESDFEVVEASDSNGSTSRRNQRDLQVISGTRKVLVVRVTAADYAPTFSREQIGDSVFGSLVGGSDMYNLASQYKACSYGKLLMVPETSKSSVVKGVVEVSISLFSAASTLSQMQSEAATKLYAKGITTSDYQHIMYCTPPPVNSKVAYSNTNGPVAVFNDKFCLGLSTQMHEVGHNLGMSHSGAGTDPYADKSDYMGYSGSNSDTPLQCFNGAKSFQLGWYKDRVVDIYPSSKGTFNGKLVGVAQYGSIVDNTHTVIIHVVTPDGIDDIFVAYNRAVGINVGTSASYSNKVLVTQGASDSLSWLLQSLGVGSKVYLSNLGFSRPLVIAVTGSGTGYTYKGAVDFTNVYVGLTCYSDSDCNYGSSCSNDMCIASNNRVDSPTSSPISQIYKQAISTPNVSSTSGQKRAYGIMFDMVAASSSYVSVESLEILTAASGSIKVDLWTMTGTCSGQQGLSSSSWSKQQFTSTAKGINSLTTLTLPLPVIISKGSVNAFYLRIYVSTPGDAFIAYNEIYCKSFGATIASDSNLSLKGGYMWTSTGAPLGGPNDSTPRCFNGVVQYRKF